MVVDFSVERNRRVAIVADNRLVSAFQVDDLQPDRAQRRLAAFEDTLLVGSTMRKRFRDALRHAPAGVLIETSKPRDSTHLAYRSPFPDSLRLPSILTTDFR